MGNNEEGCRQTAVLYKIVYQIYFKSTLQITYRVQITNKFYKYFTSVVPKLGKHKL